MLRDLSKNCPPLSFLLSLLSQPLLPTSTDFIVAAEGSTFYLCLRQALVSHFCPLLAAASAEATAAACAEADLVLENPPTAEGATWYPPYEHLSGPFDLRRKELYQPFSEGETLKLCRMLIMGNPNFRGDAKGCGFDFDKLESADKDNEFCLALFPIHNYPLKDALAKSWMPLDWPWKMPIDQIKEYFGEEVGFYFGFLSALTTGMVPIVPLGIAAQVTSLGAPLFVAHARPPPCHSFCWRGCVTPTPDSPPRTFVYASDRVVGGVGARL